MPGKALAVRKVSVLLLQPGTVEQDQLGHVARGLRAVDFAAEPVQYQSRQVAAMVEVGMGQHHRIDVARRHVQALPVEFTQVLQSLEQATIDQDACVATGEQVLGAGDSAGSAEAGQ